MAKNIFQDMVKINSTRKDNLEVIPPSRKKTQTDIKPVSSSRIPPRPPKTFSPVEPEPTQPSRYGMWMVAIGSVIFLFFALSFFFAKAKITVTPKTIDLNLSENLTAEKNALEDELSFEVISISGEESITASGGEEKDVNEEAKGMVVIYNDFSTAPQTLDINTRLEGSNGKIYKTDVKVVVPGKKANGSPGSVEVGIHASESGADYNSQPLDFKIFGFKGTSKYEKFYARSKGSIAGGLSGRFKMLSPEENDRVKNELYNKLKLKLEEKARSEIPEGFVLFENAGILSVEDVPMPSTNLGSEVTMRLKGTFSGILLNEEELTKKIVDRALPNYDGSPVKISNLGSLSFELSSQNLSFRDVSLISFRLSGVPKVVWQVDTKALADAIRDKKKKDFITILQSFPSIVSADVSMKPIWKSAFPEELEDIKIVIKEN